MDQGLTTRSFVNMKPASVQPHSLGCHVLVTSIMITALLKACACRLQDIVKLGALNIRPVTQQSLVTLLPLLFPSGWEGKREISWDPSTHPSRQWVDLLWQELGEVSLVHFVKLPLLPCNGLKDAAAPGEEVDLTPFLCQLLPASQSWVLEPPVGRLEGAVPKAVVEVLLRLGCRYAELMLSSCRRVCRGS